MEVISARMVDNDIHGNRILTTAATRTVYKVRMAHISSYQTRHKQKQENYLPGKYNKTTVSPKKMESSKEDGKDQKVKKHTINR